MSKSHYSAGVFNPFKHSLSGGVSWDRKTEKYREYSRKKATEAAMVSAPPVTARELSKEDGFQKLCENCGVKPTVRQARKFLNKSGTVYKNRKKKPA